MAHYAAFDVSDKETAIHVLDEHGRLVWKGKRASEPEVLAAALRRHAPELRRVGLETGQLAPGHFRRSRSVGAYLGLTPKRHQSGETDHGAGVSKRGDKLLRSYLFEAAACLLIRVQRPSALKGWGLALVRRLGFKRAAVAVARKIGVVLHAMWTENKPFEAWPGAAAAPAAA